MVLVLVLVVVVGVVVVLAVLVMVVMVIPFGRGLRNEIRHVPGYIPGYEQHNQLWYPGTPVYIRLIVYPGMPFKY